MSHVYDNIALKPFKKDRTVVEQKTSAKISTVQNNMKPDEEKKVRKGSADILRSCAAKYKKSKSNSFSDVNFKSKWFFSVYL